MIGATIRKDVALLLRDRGRLLMLFVLPVVFTVVFGSMFHFGPDRAEPRPIALAVAPGDPRGEAIAQALARAPGFAARPMPSGKAVDAAVARGEVIAGLIVPAAPAPVELSIDLGAPVQAVGPVQGALTGLVARALAPAAAAPPPVIARSPPGLARERDDVSAFQVTVPANAVLFAFFLTMTVAMSFAHERTTGTWRRLLAAPVPRWKALVGKLVPYYLIGCAQLAILFGLGFTVFGMRLAGSPLPLILISAEVALCACALGLLVAALGWTERQIGSTVPVIVLVMSLLGGCMFPRVLMPPFMQSVGKIVPHAWALDGYHAALVRAGTSVGDVASELAALLAFTAAFAGIGLARFRFE